MTDAHTPCTQETEPSPEIAVLAQFKAQFAELYHKAVHDGKPRLAALIRCCGDAARREIDQIHPPDHANNHVTELTTPQEIAAHQASIYEERAPTQTFARALLSKDIAELKMWVKAIQLVEREVVPENRTAVIGGIGPI